MKTKPERKSKPWAFRDKWPTVDWSLSNQAIAAQLGCSVSRAYMARRKHERQLHEIIRGLPGCSASPDGTIRINRQIQPVLYDAALQEELDTVLSVMLESGEIKIVGERNGEPLYEKTDKFDAPVAHLGRAPDL